MSLLKLKNTVQAPKVVIIAAATINAANVMGLKEDMLVTSGNDSIHMRGSRHYTDAALDFRTHHLSDTDRAALRREVKRRLGATYDVLLEDPDGPNEHLHVEWNG